MATVNNNTTSSTASTSAIEQPASNTSVVAKKIFQCNYCGQTHTNYRNHLQHHWCVKDSEIAKLPQDTPTPDLYLMMPAPLSYSPPLNIISQMQPREK